MGNIIHKNYNKNYTKEEVIEILKSDKSESFDKIFAIINLDCDLNQEDFNILLNNLTNQPSPLRESTAMKIDEINLKHPDFFLDSSAQNKILKAIVDINPNVSRVICNIIANNKKLAKDLEKKIIEEIMNLLKEIEILNDFKKSHAKNKKLFSLYWLLESLSCCMSEKYNSQVLEILKITINFSDYTIREKTAKILKKTGKIPNFIQEKIKDEQNFYVKYQIYDKIDNDN